MVAWSLTRTLRLRWGGANCGSVLKDLALHFLPLKWLRLPISFVFFFFFASVNKRNISL